MKLRIQYIFSLVMLFNLHALVAQEHNEETKNDKTEWQEEFPNQPTTNGLETLEAPPGFKAAIASKAEWWKLFGYEQLNSLVSLALEENYAIKMAQSQVGESREEIKIAKASRLPSISLNPSFNRQEFSGNRPMPFEGPVERIRYNTYALPLDVAYEVDVFGRIKHNIEASEFNYEASAALQEASKLDIAAQAARYFILLLMLDSEAEVLSNTRKTREENLEIVKIRYEAGLTNEIDLHRAQSELSSVAVQIKNLEIERRDVELTLATICGQPSGSFSVVETGITYAVPSITLRDTASLSSYRPDLVAAGFAVEANKKQIKSARRNLYPSLYLSGSSGLLAGESNQVFEEDSRNWLVGATFSVPIFEGGRRQALLNIRKHQLERSISYLRQEKLVANQEVMQKLSAMERLKEQLEAQQDFLLAAQRAAYLSQQRYLKGLVTYLEVVDAERIVLEAERLSIQLIGKQLLNTVDLMVAMGGDLNAIGTVEN